MSGLAIRARLERSTPDFDGIRADLGSSRALMAAMGKRAEKELRAHFLGKNSQPNKKGFPRSNFWSRRIRANTALNEIGADYAVVTIAAPEMAQKVFGGTITPKESKYLALPMVAEAANRSPRLFADLHFEPRRGGKVKGALVDASGKTIYLLATSVTQAPDPTALPAPGALEAACADEGRKFLGRRSRA